MAINLLVLPGDGIGPEITAATVAVLEAADRLFSLGIGVAHAEIGLVTLQRDGTTLPLAVMEAARAADGVILGPISHNIYPSRDEGGINVSGEFRIALDLYANIRPSRSRPGLAMSRTAMDLVIVRENTEGFYADRNMFAGNGEFMPTEDMALAIRKITAASCRRIAETAFALARKRRRKVTAVHKANVLRVSTASSCARSGRSPGAIPISSSRRCWSTRWRRCWCAIPSATTSSSPPTCSATSCPTSRRAQRQPRPCRQPQFRLGPCRGAGAAGSAPDIAGQDRANPTSLILSAAMLLEWLGERQNEDRLFHAGRRIAETIDAVLLEPQLRTPDLGGPNGTKRFGEIVAERLGG